MVLIGLHGRLGSGKDTAFGYIHEWAAERGVHAARRGFADMLKHSFARLFIEDCSIDEGVAWCDRIKFDGHLTIREERADNPTDPDSQLSALEHRITGRKALQRYGTEAHRQVFGEDFWVDALLPIGDSGLRGSPPAWEGNFHTPLYPAEAQQIACITDLRFENEARRIRELGGQIWKINRPGRGGNGIIPHASEVELPNSLVDVGIGNYAGLDEFQQNVIEAAETHIAPLLPQEEPA